MGTAWQIYYFCKPEGDFSKCRTSALALLKSGPRRLLTSFHMSVVLRTSALSIKVLLLPNGLGFTTQKTETKRN